MKRRILSLVAFVLLAAITTRDVGAQTIQTNVQAIPAELATLTPPTPVLADGRRHYLYELLIRNFGRADLVLTNVDVLDARGAVVTSYAGDALAAVMTRPGAPVGSNARTIGGGFSAVVFIDITIRADAPLIARLSHRLTFNPVRLEGGQEQTTLDGASVGVRTAPAIVIAPPLRGGNWVTLNALSNFSSHRRTLLALNGRATIAQRFAVDFTRVNTDGLAFTGDPAINSNWAAHGAEVLAVANGRVIALRDGLTENDPTSDTKAIPISVDTATGNYIVLDIGDGHFALYAHLQPGRFRVHLGQRVHVGEALAALGNSGKSDAPHLHFQIMDSAGPLTSEGLPFALRQIAVQGHVDSLAVLSNGTGWHSSGLPRLAQREMPLLNDVISFGE